ncbi:MAG: hypothetical protein KAH22_00995 [Thiotrichaceae bacterium]|nr:hypothetical protein [Thiotrichaceae bacterium]
MNILEKSIVISLALLLSTPLAWAENIHLILKHASDANCDGIADTVLHSQFIRIKPKQCIVYQVSAKNTGHLAVQNVQIKGQIPAYTLLHGADSATQVSAQTVSRSLPSLSSGAENSFQYWVQVL